MYISSGDAGSGVQYTVLGMIFAVASDPSPPKAMLLAANQLKAAATSDGADAVLFTGFSSRPAVSKGCWGDQQVFEVLSWGTSVKIVR
jgi:hypothetical protein